VEAKKVCSRRLPGIGIVEASVKTYLKNTCRGDGGRIKTRERRGGKGEKKYSSVKK